MADARSVMFAAIIIFVFGISYLSMHYVSNQMYDQIIKMAEMNTSRGMMDIWEGSKAVSERMDYVIFGLFIALILGLIITSWFVAGHPIFTFIYALVLIIIVAISSIFSYVWEQALTTVIGASASSFPITNHLISNIALYMTIVGFVSIIIMFAKPQLVNTNAY